MVKWKETEDLPDFLAYMTERGGAMSRGLYGFPEDHGTLFAYLWGAGTPREPWSFSVHYEPDDWEHPEVDEPNFRLPTPDEVSEAFYELVAEGAILQPMPIISNGSLGNTRPKAIVLIQVGAVPGTEAGRRWELGVGLAGGANPINHPLGGIVRS